MGKDRIVTIAAVGTVVVVVDKVTEVTLLVYLYEWCIVSPDGSK